MKEKKQALDKLSAHLIPDLKTVPPHILYLRSTRDGPISVSMFGEFKKLPQ